MRNLANRSNLMELSKWKWATENRMQDHKSISVSEFRASRPSSDSAHLRAGRHSWAPRLACSRLIQAIGASSSSLHNQFHPASELASSARREKLCRAALWPPPVATAGSRNEGSVKVFRFSANSPVRRDRSRSVFFFACSLPYTFFSINISLFLLLSLRGRHPPFFLFLFRGLLEANFTLAEF